METRLATVEDSRSLRLDDGRVLRLAGIEPFDLILPEDREEGAEAALRERLQALVGSGPLLVQIVSDKLDRYRRDPAMVAADGALVQETLVAEGLALAFAGGEPLPCFPSILAAEGAAREARRGFWSGAALRQADPAALADRIGRFAIMEGKILTVGNRNARTYLNFGAFWAEDVTAEIDAGDRELFGGEEALAALAGRRVRIRGFVQEKSGPMMEIRSPMQLELLGEEAGGKGSEP